MVRLQNRIGKIVAICGYASEWPLVAWKHTCSFSPRLELTGKTWVKHGGFSEVPPIWSPGIFTMDLDPGFQAGKHLGKPWFFLPCLEHPVHLGPLLVLVILNQELGFGLPTGVATL